jgi:predicted permease
VAEYHKLWLRSVLAYTVAGCVSATLMGITLGVIGDLLGGRAAGGIQFYLVAIFGVSLAAREWGVISFRLPEHRRQTEKFWVHEFGFVMASAMWGLHIGLGFATRVTYGGFWLLVTVALVLGDPLYSAVLMLVYWLGRALPVWVAPALLESASSGLEKREENGEVYHRIVAFALVWATIVAVLLALRTNVT